MEGQAVWVHPLSAGQYSQLVHCTNTQPAWKANYLLLHFACRHADASHCFPTVADAEGMTLEVFNQLIPTALEQGGFSAEEGEKKETNCEPTTH